jgi:hypothetical protein
VIDTGDVDVFLGLDVGKGEHHGTAVTRAGKRVFDKRLPNSEPKMRAVHIDDRALHFTGNWDTALPEALRRIGEPADPPAQPAADVPALTIRQPWLAASLGGRQA